MESSTSIFRKAALDKLSSPDQLDQLMRVTSPKSWLALAACGALVLTAVLWSIFGAIETEVSGPGILIRRGGVFMVSAQGNGNIAKILVLPGDHVTRGRVLARVDQPELTVKIKQGQVILTNLEQQLSELGRFQKQEEVKEQEGFRQQRASLSKMRGDYQVQIAALEQRLALLNEIKMANAVSGVQLLDLTNQLFQARHDLARTDVDLQLIDQNALQSRERRTNQVHDLAMRILQARHDLDSSRQLLGLESEVISPFDGQVVEIMVKQGQLISAGGPVMSLEEAGQALEAKVFVSSAEGKKIRPGMPVAVSPASVKKEEYGFIRGSVTNVSEFPTTPQGMMAVLGNPSLVAQFSQDGAPIEVTVRLNRAARAGLVPGRTDGIAYQWSSAKGSHLFITPGTLCQASITVATQRPIAFILPGLKKTAGL